MTIRVLHVVGGLPCGGTETWLVNVLRRLDRGRIQMDFVVHTAEEQHYTAAARELGAQVLHCPHSNHPLRYMVQLRQLIRQQGGYDVLHTHVHHFSGVVLTAGRQAQVPVRLVHSHTAPLAGRGLPKLPRRGYEALTRTLISRNATAGLAASAPAAAALFGARWRDDARLRVMACGIDLEPFRRGADRAAIRRELQLPPDAVVLMQVGRLCPEKNPAFFLDVLARAAQRSGQVFGVLVGEGELRSSLEARALRLGAADRLRLTGARSDVAALLKAADVFLFPSHFEGLGLALIEAQAAGLPCLCSDAIPQEAHVAPQLVTALPIDDAAQWADRALELAGAPVDVDAAFKLIAASPFNLDRSLESLALLYESLVGARVPAPAEDGAPGAVLAAGYGKRGSG